MGLLLPGLTPSPETKEIDALLGRLYNIHQYIFAIYVPLVFGIMMMSCFWAYTQSMASHYQNKAEDWQACLLDTSYTVPLSEYIALQQAAGRNCAIGLFFTPQTSNCTSTSVACVQNLQKTCLSGTTLPEVKIPVGELLQSLSYLGLQTAIFSMISHAGLNRALRHPSWIAATNAFIIWGVWAMLTYYTSSPVLPIPGQTNATLITIMYYAKKYVFDNFNSGNNNCGDAYKYLWLYITMMLIVIIINFVIFLMGIVAELARQRAPNRKMYRPLQGTAWPIIACSVAALFYFFAIFGKMFSSWTAVDSIRSYDKTVTQAAQDKDSVWFEDSFFPFQVSNLDINTLAWIGSFMAVIRGYTRQSVSAFRLSAIMAGAYILTGYPGLVGGLQFYKDNDFQDFDKCRDFFRTTPQSIGFGYPNEDESTHFCQAFRLTLTGYLGLFLMMHVVMITASMTYESNRSRESAIFDPLDPHHPSDSHGQREETINAIRVQGSMAKA